MKIAILGSAPSSVMLAPFRNAAHEAWVQGKINAVAQAHAQIGGEFEIWGCSPACWAVVPRATVWFELHRWEPQQPWFGPEYMDFLRRFKGTVWTGGAIPEIPNHRVYPIDTIEEKFASYNLTSSPGLMLALAIDTIDKVRAARTLRRNGGVGTECLLPQGVDPAELDKGDEDDVIGMWGIDMAAGEEYAYQRPGCQNMILEAMRRCIGVYLPPESDLMRPMPVYGISEWDHNYIKLTSRARELNSKIERHAQSMRTEQEQLTGAQGEMAALNHFVATWTSAYGMKHGLTLRQDPGTGLGSGITHYDGRPITRMTLGAPEPSKADVMNAMAQPQEIEDLRHARKQLDELALILTPHIGERGSPEALQECARRIINERASAMVAAQDFSARLARQKKPKRRR